MKKLATLSVVLMLILCIPVLGIALENSGNPENFCRNGLFPQEGPEIKLAKLVGPKNAKVHFLKDDEGCPKTKDLNCQAKSYVIPGDQVLVSRKYGNWVCSWYQTKQENETVGWLPAESLIISEPEANLALEKWIGTWTNYDKSLNIWKDNKTGFLTVEGEEVFRATSKPQGTELMLVDELCEVTLRLIGNYMLANADEACGGTNGGFTGIYLKPEANK